MVLLTHSLTAQVTSRGAEYDDWLRWQNNCSEFVYLCDVQQGIYVTLTLSTALSYSHNGPAFPVSLVQLLH